MIIHNNNSLSSGCCVLIYYDPTTCAEYDYNHLQAFFEHIEQSLEVTHISLLQPKSIEYANFFNELHVQTK